MNKEKIFEVFKLTNCIVRCAHGLLTLYSRNTDTDMCSGNHVNIVSPITDSQCNKLRIVLLD